MNKYLNNSSAIKENKPDAYHWEVDLNHLSTTEDISIKTLKDNLESVIEVLNNERYNIPGVINFYNTKIKNIVSIFVIHEKEKPINDIKSFINMAVDKARKKIFIDSNSAVDIWNKIKLHNDLNDNLIKDNENNKKIMKI